MFHEDTEALRSRAFHIWESEGRPDGRALEHWLAAVSAVREQMRLLDGTQSWWGDGPPRGEAAWMRRMLWQPQPHDAASLRDDALARPLM